MEYNLLYEKFIKMYLKRAIYVLLYHINFYVKRLQVAKKAASFCALLSIDYKEQLVFCLSFFVW